jgi:hypothetical protein
LAAIGLRDISAVRVAENEEPTPRQGIYSGPTVHVSTYIADRLRLSELLWKRNSSLVWLDMENNMVIATKFHQVERTLVVTTVYPHSWPTDAA